MIEYSERTLVKRYGIEKKSYIDLKSSNLVVEGNIIYIIWETTRWNLKYIFSNVMSPKTKCSVNQAEFRRVPTFLL